MKPQNATTRPLPQRSATPPANGPSAPQIRFWIAIAREKTSLGHWFSRLIGCRNRPKPERTPAPSSRIRQQAVRMTTGLRAGEAVMRELFYSLEELVDRRGERLLVPNVLVIGARDHH